ncbi:TetR family transcriptional regulator [Streptomyces sp. SHP 1-2]|uniref:TetR family transcriptional regulator n=1 Tax=Streptomyces sp. SHP 1-2 TaxID=2769489 RepID=UPI0022389C60|nr:TetR family transcriptional regulator [Streptomyces sp. SHP 1-2]MCW5249683.1 TetR family transcriptional regulator [Streptomyces sp. SHP 1-2]
MHAMSEKNVPGGGLRERKKRATRAALAESAVRLAAEHGADRVTVEAISAAAGVSVRTFFNYFDSRDDAFVAIDPDAGIRMRRAVLDAPFGLSPVEALHDALTAELAEAEHQHELWRLHIKVLHTAPHLLVRMLCAHMAHETELAEAVALRLRSTAPGGRNGPSGPAAPEPVGPARGAAADWVGAGAGAGSHEDRRAALDLYPRLLAAVAVTAVRTSVEHWFTHQEDASLLPVFDEAFALLTAGLPAPPA